MKRLENKVAVITGGAGSIGAATARKFLDNGAKVVLVDLQEAALQQTVATLNSPDVSYVAADVTKSDDVQR
ncbi:MAG: SDR family NAD(P)-dependent oxidoreductase, partial [Sphingobacteriales bacterium]